MRIVIAVLMLLVTSVCFAEVTYEKINDESMAIVQESRLTVSRSDLEQRKVDLEKALVEINALLGEADKLGITKVNDV